MFTKYDYYIHFQHKIYIYKHGHGLAQHAETWETPIRSTLWLALAAIWLCCFMPCPCIGELLPLWLAQIRSSLWQLSYAHAARELGTHAKCQRMQCETNRLHQTQICYWSLALSPTICLFLIKCFIYKLFKIVSKFYVCFVSHKTFTIFKFKFHIIT